MRSYSRLFQMWNDVAAQPIDPQLVLRCREECYIPLETILSQYKWMVKVKQYDNNYKTVREYLIKVFGEQTINDLEAM